MHRLTSVYLCTIPQGEASWLDGQINYGNAWTMWGLLKPASVAVCGMWYHTLISTSAEMLWMTVAPANLYIVDHTSTMGSCNVNLKWPFKALPLLVLCQAWPWDPSLELGSKTKQSDIILLVNLEGIPNSYNVHVHCTLKESHSFFPLSLSLTHIPHNGWSLVGSG